MFAGVHVSLETFQHVVAVAIAGICRGNRGVMRAPAAAANKDDKRFLVDLLFELGDKMRIADHPRITRPFNRGGARKFPDPVQFRAAAHVHQFCARCGLQDFMGFAGIQRAFVRQVQFFGALLRGL